MNMDFWNLLAGAQAYISARYAAALTDGDDRAQLRAYIEKYARDQAVEENELPEVTQRLYEEMAEYSVLTRWLCTERAETIEELNVNAWDDVTVTYTDGRLEKVEAFHSPGHAADIVRRLLHHSGMILDNATPMAQGHLPGNVRITALKEPLVDKDCGVAASIRLIHPQRVTREGLLETGAATADMLDFLSLCIRYGVSLAVAGATSSGKTTLLGTLLAGIPDDKRVFSIESGARELSLVRRENGRMRNNVVHTLSRPSDTASCDISQEDLVVASLRFDPDLLVIGEMRDVECYAAVEASLTGHTVVSTVHAGAGAAAHTRIALLCQKRFPLDFQTSLMQAGQAFPLVAYVHKLEDNTRKILDITECEILPDLTRRYRTIYRYRMDGGFESPDRPSDSLKQRLLQYGAPRTDLERFFGKGEKP